MDEQNVAQGVVVEVVDLVPANTATVADPVSGSTLTGPEHYQRPSQPEPPQK